MDTLHSPENPYKKTVQLFTAPSKSIAWTVSQILWVDILAERHAKPYAYFKWRWVTILDWKILIVASPGLFIEKKGTYYVHPEHIWEFLKKWKELLDNPKAYTPTDHVYLSAKRA